MERILRRDTRRAIVKGSEGPPYSRWWGGKAAQSAVNPARAQVLDFQIVLHAMVRAFAPMP